MGLMKGLWKLFKYTMIFGAGVYVGSHYNCDANKRTVKEGAKGLIDRLEYRDRAPYHSGTISQNIQKIIDQNPSLRGIRFQYKKPEPKRIY